MDEIKLPELPNAAIIDPGRFGFAFTALQMREYAERAVREATTQVDRNAVLEEAATLAYEEVFDLPIEDSYAAKRSFAKDVKDAILSLKSAPVSATQEQAMDSRNQIDEGDNAWFNDSDMGAR